LTTAWYDEENRLDPSELLTVTFPESRFGRRGFEAEPVREYLHGLQAEFVRLVSERASLWQEVQRLRQRIISGMTDGDLRAVLFGEADVDVHVVRIRSAARVTEEATLGRDDIKHEAQRYSDMILGDAHAQAREAAIAALDGAPAPQTGPERRAAQAELAYLRAYSYVYRSHLRAYTEEVLHRIEESEHAGEAASPEPEETPGDAPSEPDAAADTSA
jgi:cell division septum initiation protein DivIVA